MEESEPIFSKVTYKFIAEYSITAIWIFQHHIKEAEMFLEVLQNSQENTCARASFLLKMQASDLDKNTFLMNTSGRLILYRKCTAEPYSFLVIHNALLI